MSLCVVCNNTEMRVEWRVKDEWSEILVISYQPFYAVAKNPFDVIFFTSTYIEKCQLKDFGEEKPYLRNI